MSTGKTKIALLHRYGLAGWICCGGHSIPRMIELLRAHEIEVHVFGPRSTDPLPEGVARNVVMHELGYTWDRANPSHKWSRTILWFLMLPILCLYCRFSGMAAVLHIDDTLPLTSWILRIFYGRRFALTIMDFFCQIYTEKLSILKPLVQIVDRLDLLSWKFTPVLFTKVFSTQQYLESHGVRPEQMFIARNPCDHAIFHPLTPEEKQTARNRWGFSNNDFVLSHHGIMHPNKGNDWIIYRIAEMKSAIPGIRLLLIGNGPETANVKHLVKKLNMEDCVIMPGWIRSGKELNNALNAADIGIVMRVGHKTDHFHMTETLSHEMACGKPLLAANLKGIAEIVHDEENGMLFSPHQPEEFNTRLLRLFHDKTLRRRLGEAAARTSREVSDLETCAHQVADPVLKLIGIAV